MKKYKTTQTEMEQKKHKTKVLAVLHVQKKKFSMARLKNSTDVSAAQVRFSNYVLEADTIDNECKSWTNLYLVALQRYDDVILDETSWHKTCAKT